MPDPAWRERTLAGLPVADVALASLLLVVGLTSAVLREPPEGPRLVTVPVAVVMTASIAWRRRFPLLVVVVVSVAGLVQTAVATDPGSLWALAVYLVAIYSVAAHRSESAGAIGGAVLVLGLWVQEFLSHTTDYLFVVIVFGGAWVLGRLVQLWRMRAAEAEDRAADLARLAVAEERVRVARELHDVVAHGLSVIAVQADAADAALDHDSRLAREPLRAVGQQARESLEEMRRMLGILRSDDDSERSPVPGLASLDALVASVRDAGLPLEVAVEGGTHALAPTIDLTAYRVTQEALTNVLKHAGLVSTTLTIRRSPTAVRLEVVNAPGLLGTLDSTGSGNGLVGIRERVRAVGGTVTAGPDPGGGFRLVVDLPPGDAP